MFLRESLGARIRLIRTARSDLGIFWPKGAASVIGRNRVVITGIGVLAANGIGKEAFWNSLLAGESGIGPITLFDASELPSIVAGEVSDFDPHNYIDKSLKPKRLARFTQLALSAANLAIDDAGIRHHINDSIVPICLGVSTSATDVIESQVLRIEKKGARFASPLTAITSLPQAGAGSIASMLGIKTQSITISTGCPAGLDAVAQAFHYIQSGRSEIAIAGGADAPITKLTIATFCAANMIPNGCEDPVRVSRPFDLKRRGGVIAEGACVFVLESLEHALERKANIYLEIKGYGCSGDSPRDIPSSGLETSMLAAINNSGLMPSQIDYISAHGPSDEFLDLAETNMIKKVFSAHAYNLAVNSIKGATGNPIAAAGPMQIASCAMAMRAGMIPPTANYDVADPACDLDYIPKARKAKIERALINNHGFGGSNSSLVVEKIK